MLRKRLGLSTEPQPVFVGACFTLIMLLMQIYVFQIAQNGNIIPIFNNPFTLFGFISNSFKQDTIYAAIWTCKFAVPLIMLLCAAIYGKRKAKLLVLPCSLPAFYIIGNLISCNFNTYHISYVIYSVTVIFYIISAFELIKSVKPFIVYCIVICAAVLLLTLFKQPPFTLFDGSVFLSDMIYFITYHIVVANFAKAITIQKYNF